MTYRDAPGTETANCANPECGCSFVKRPGAMHQKYCSRRCRNYMTKKAGAERDAAVSKHAKFLRMQAEALGGTVQGGAMVSGTITLARREVIDLANIHEGRPELWT